MYNEIETFVQNHAFIRNLLTRPIFMQNFERNRHPSKFRKTFCAMMAYPNGTIPAANYSALPRVRRHPRPDEPLSLSLGTLTDRTTSGSGQDTRGFRRGPPAAGAMTDLLS